jgi:NAD(P)-dependent dehydrogenase (short-subunit alcohol dehydrogenase family)
MSKVWFITGASSGIGAGIAQAALQVGHQVVATARNIQKLRQVHIGADENKMAFVMLDVTNEAQVQAAVEAAVSKFGRIDILVNNAGYSLLGNFEETTQEELERQFATNFYGPVYLMRAALPIMRRQRSGYIINVSSVAGAIGQKSVSAYGASKFALEGLSLAVAHEVEPFGIKMTLVEPGFFRTDLLAAESVVWSSNLIDDYSAEGTVKDAWSGYHGQQTGDPAKLGAVLVKFADMDNPPKQFLAGSGAVDTVKPVLEARLEELRTYTNLSGSTDGNF